MAALLADIGGTNARFALAEPGGAIQHYLAFKCADYPGPAEAANAYLETVRPSTRPDRGAFSVAAPIVGDGVVITNNPWRFSIEETRRAIGLARLDMVNDFGALALSLPRFVDDELIALGGGGRAPESAMAVIGPGTGLGVAALAWSEGKWRAVPGEGGHATLPAGNEREARVIARMRERFGHVSAERALSGPGLVNLYRAVAELAGARPEELSPDQVQQRALAGACPHCREALDLFFAFLGEVAGNIAFIVGARGGLFLGGGILPRMPDALKSSTFRARFETKGRMSDFVRAIPAYLIVHPYPAFPGLAELSR